MVSTPTSRISMRHTPVNSPFLARPLRATPLSSRGRQPASPEHRSYLSLQRVVGTTCTTPAGFDAVDDSFAYIAGAAVVVVNVHLGADAPSPTLSSPAHTPTPAFSQRFYRARPTAVPTYPVTALQPAPSPSFASSLYSASPSSPTSTPKANDSRNRVAAPFLRDSPFTPLDSSDSPSGRTWTSRERIKAATCLSLSRDGRYLAVGETGYAPRVLIFSLLDASSDVPLVSMNEHGYGVNAVAWSHDTRYLASLGAINDGFLYVWKLEPRTGAARLFQQNRCTSSVRGMIWIGTCLVTFGVRHVKAWRVDDKAITPPHPSPNKPHTSPNKQRFQADTSQSLTAIACAYGNGLQKPLAGRNTLLGALIEATFTCAAVVDPSTAVICSEAGDVCLLDDSDKQLKLVPVLSLGFPIHCVAIRHSTAFVGSRSGHSASLSIDALLEGRADSVLTTTLSSTGTGIAAMAFLNNRLVSIDSRRSIDVWSDHYRPGQTSLDPAHFAIPGQGEPVMGIQRLVEPNPFDAAFLTWCGSGTTTLWDLDGCIKYRRTIAVERPASIGELGFTNQVTCMRASMDGQILIAADRLGVLRAIDLTSGDCLLDTKAHASDCHFIGTLESETRFLVASCGRDHTVQLFCRTASGTLEHFQTLEFTTRVVHVLIPNDDRLIACSLDRTVQIFDIVTKPGEADALAALPSRVISLKASPTSMAMAPDRKSVLVSMLDRIVCQFDLETGRQLFSFKCTDESGLESAVLESLVLAQMPPPRDQDVILGVSNTDKSIRIYDAQSGAFIDREWGHTEAINGAALISDDRDGSRRVISVGSDGTMMFWALDPVPSDCPSDTVASPMSIRAPSPEKDGVVSRPTLRRVLSRAELAEFQRPPALSSPAGRRSPPRALHRRVSRYNLLGSARASTTTTTGSAQKSPATTTGWVAEEPIVRRRTSSIGRASSPPPHSRVRRLTRRPSLPTFGTAPAASLSSSSSSRPAPATTATRKRSSPSLAGSGFGSLSMATEQACRTLRAYRRRLASVEAISADSLAELDAELRLTATALGDRAVRTQAISETVLSGLLDQYSERLVSMLDAKLGLGMREQASRHSDKESDRDASTPEGSDEMAESGAEMGREGDGAEGDSDKDGVVPS